MLEQRDISVKINSAPEILPEAIKCIHQQQSYVEHGLLKETDGQPSNLNYQAIMQSFSVREFDIFRLLATGLTAHKIATELCLGYKTVANYVTQIKKKLQVSSIAELAHIAIILGIMKH